MYTVAIAFDCGNLLPAAKALRERYPDRRIILCADDDIERPGNPGLTKAREAAAAVGALVAVPDFGPDRPAGATDFNDLAAHRGPDAVREGNAGARVTLAQVMQAFTRWLHLPDPGSVYVALGAVAANYLNDDDPVWVLEVGPPSGGKTEVLMAFKGLPYVRLASTLTEPALLHRGSKRRPAARVDCCGRSATSGSWCSRTSPPPCRCTGISGHRCSAPYERSTTADGFAISGQMEGEG